MDLRKEEVWAPRVSVPLEHSCLDEQNELLSDSSPGGASPGTGVSPLRLLAIPIGRQRARMYAVFALNHDDFYDLDPLTSSPSPIRVLYGDNSSLSYIVAAESGSVTAFHIAHLSYRTMGWDIFLRVLSMIRMHFNCRFVILVLFFLINLLFYKPWIILLTFTRRDDLIWMRSGGRAFLVLLVTDVLRI